MPHRGHFTLSMRTPFSHPPRRLGPHIPAARWLAADWDPRVETGVAAPAGLVATFAAAAAMSPLRPSVTVVAGTVVMAVVVSLTGWFGSWAATLATVGVAWLMLNGFIEDRYGELRWHGWTDVVVLGVLLVCGAAVASLRHVQIGRRRRAVARSMAAELEDMADPSHDTSGERHD